MLSPDAAYLVPETLKGLTKEQGARLPHLCPDFVIELLSESDDLKKSGKKMELLRQNGAKLSWLVDPYQQKVFVYVKGAEPHSTVAQSLRGTGPVDGFTLDLAEVWRCYEI